MEEKTYPEFSIRYPLLLKTFMKRPVRMYPNETGIVYRNPDTGRIEVADSSVSNCAISDCAIGWAWGVAKDGGPVSNFAITDCKIKRGPDIKNNRHKISNNATAGGEIALVTQYPFNTVS